MIKFLFLCDFLVFFFGIVSAQDDNFPDYRNKKENFLKMQEKDLRFDLASFALAGIDERIGKLPLRSLAPTDFGSDFIEFEGYNVKVAIRSARFDTAHHKLKFYDEKHLVKIDNRAYFGDYGSIPTKKISSLQVIIEKDTVAIPPEALADLYHPVFTYSDNSGTPRTNNAVYLSNDSHNVYIYMLNEELIGKYEVTWIIRDKKYVRRVVDSGIMK